MTKKITLSISDDLYERLKEMPEINNSRIFQYIAKEIIEIMDEIKEREPNLSEKELFSQAEIIQHLRADIKLMSYEFGEKVFNEWIIQDEHRKFLRKITTVDTQKSEYIQEKLYEYTESQLEPIHVYENIFFKNADTQLNRNEFLRGFIEHAKLIYKAVKDPSFKIN